MSRDRAIDPEIETSVPARINLFFSQSRAELVGVCVEIQIDIDNRNLVDVNACFEK